MSAATAFAWSGPAPPKATSASSRGSWPRWTDTSRSAPAIVSFVIARMPSAAASSDRPGAAPGPGAERKAGGVGDRLPRRRRLLHVERHLAADQPRREMADDDVGVGDRRGLAAPGAT